MTLADYISKTYIINLLDRADRRAAIMPRLQEIGWGFVPHGRVEFYGAKRPTDPGNFSSLGLRGCYESHLNIWKLALRNKLSSVMVLEDDMVPLPLLAKHQGAIVEQLKSTPDWGMVYLGYTGDALKDQVRKVDPAKPLHENRTPMWMAHSYIINGWVLPDLIRHAEAIMSRPEGHPEGGAMHLDAALWQFRLRNPEMKVLLASRIMTAQAASKSDISTSKWDSIPVISNILPKARALKTWLVNQ